jgi:predicted GIY-YIG superfamily endonuclease
MNLLKICLSSTYFKFLENYYHQTEGTAMGSPISPVIAEIFLQDMEMKLIPGDKNIFFWRRYVDDVWSIVRGRKVEEVLRKLNNYNKSINFTIEKEVDGKLPFLEVMTYEKPDRSIGHHVYRKPTHTNTYLNFKSFHPISHKIGVVDTLLTRAFRICDNEHLTEEIIFTAEILQFNDYPEEFILKRLDIVKNKINSPKNNTNESRIILPWAGPVTRHIAKFIRKHMKIELGYFPGIKIGTILCNAKEKPKQLQSGVYSISCECGVKYIGESGRDFNIRIQEHIQDIRRAAVRKSPVALHMHENDHQLNQSSFKLIVKEPRKFFRKFKEALYIKQAPLKMNTSRGMFISPFWCSALVSFLNYAP